MGLDAWAFAHAPGAGDDDRIELAYWRKFNHLQGWMMRLYEERGGEGDFNCKKLYLEAEDLDRLTADMGKGLPHQPGFFFGGANIYPKDLETTKTFIEKARKLLAEGFKVYYDSWW